MRGAQQRDILQVEGVGPLVLVCSKNFFNASGMSVVCPLLEGTIPGPLHIPVETEKGQTRFVHCEKLKLLDLSQRGWKKKDRVPLFQMMNITDAIQGIFDYI